MTTRQLRKKKYTAIKEIITKNAQLNPSDGCYNMTLEINKTDYVLKLQFTDNNKLIVWNAMEVNHGEDGQVNYTLIIDNKVLSALTEILLWQNVPMFKKRAQG